MNVFVPKVKIIHKQNYSLAAVRYGVTESRLLEFKESLGCFKWSHDFNFLIFKNTPACQRGFSFHERQFAAKTSFVASRFRGTAPPRKEKFKKSLWFPGTILIKQRNQIPR